jgi:hypothetical protein
LKKRHIQILIAFSFISSNLNTNKSWFKIANTITQKRADLQNPTISKNYHNFLGRETNPNNMLNKNNQKLIAIFSLILTLPLENSARYKQSKSIYANFKLWFR